MLEYATINYKVHASHSLFLNSTKCKMYVFLISGNNKNKRLLKNNKQTESQTVVVEWEPVEHSPYYSIFVFEKLKMVVLISDPNDLKWKL
jgi:hypothetical protein